MVNLFRGLSVDAKYVKDFSTTGKRNTALNVSLLKILKLIDNGKVQQEKPVIIIVILTPSVGK